MFYMNNKPEGNISMRRGKCYFTLHCIKEASFYKCGNGVGVLSRNVSEP